MTFRHFPEPRQAHGGLAAEGALNLLGRPDLDPLAVLIREAVQNSWDARLAEHGPVEFEVALNETEARQREALAKVVFSDLPPRGVLGDSAADTSTLRDLKDSLADAHLRILTLTDRGTSGLGGPVRADRPAAEGESTDFVDFVFNIGQPRDKELGGGTYGFGKTISYLVSRCRTVLIHTRTEAHGRLEHRLIAQAIGSHYSLRGENFTGRHWWGNVSDDNMLRPVTGAQAQKTAARIGLPEFEGSTTGTTIAIIDPDLGGRNSEVAVQFLAETLTWNFWPKMVAERGRSAAMSFFVSNNGNSCAIPDPRRTPPMSGYVQALRAARECEAGRANLGDFAPVQVFELRSQRPQAVLGWLALTPAPAARAPLTEQPIASAQTDMVASPRGFEGRSHHVALMRQAELVVRYLPGPEIPERSIEFAGVFKAAKGVDSAFAAAEPPTHDDWRSALVVDSWDRRYVNVALREIKLQMVRAFAQSALVQGDETPISGVVIADSLGHLLAPVDGTGATPAPPRPGVGGRPRLRTARIDVSDRTLERANGRTLLLVDFKVIPAAGTDATTVEAAATAASSDGAAPEHDPPANAPVPRVIGFRVAGAETWDSSIVVPADYSETITVVVEQVAGTASIVDIRPIEGSAP
jgi:hypothetical protein